ncbi:MAG: sialidase family protein, partial [Methylococcales bacterium]
MKHYLFVLSFILSSSAHAANTQAWSLPAPANAAQPNLSQAPNGDLALSWIERLPAGGHRLRMSTYSTQGKWSSPSTIATGKNFFVNWADFPATQFLADGSLWAHNLEKNGVGTYAYDVILRRSGDKGKTWSKPMRVNAPVEAEHGFVSLWPWSKNQLGVAWLDGGATVSSKDMSAHDHGGSMMTLRAAVV